MSLTDGGPVFWTAVSMIRQFFNGFVNNQLAWRKNEERVVARLDNLRREFDVLTMLSRPNVESQTLPHEHVHSRSVFIVDDDDALVEALAELLREEGYAVEAHTNVTDA